MKLSDCLKGYAVDTNSVANTRGKLRKEGIYCWEQCQLKGPESTGFSDKITGDLFHWEGGG